MKRGILFLLVFILCSFTVLASSTQIAGGKIRITLENTIPERIQPGEYFDALLKIENIHIEDVKEKDLTNTYIEVVDSYPFSVDKGEVFRQHLGHISSSRVVETRFRIRTADDASNGFNKLRLKFYSKETGSLDADLDVYIQSIDTTLDVISVKFDSESLAPGSISELSVNLKNNAKTPLKDISVVLSLTGTRFATVNSVSARKIRYIGIGETATIPFTIVTDPETKPGIYQIPLMVIFHDLSGNKTTKEMTFGVLVNSKPEFQVDIEESEIFKKEQTGKVIFSISNTGTADMKYLSARILDGNNYEVISNSRKYIGNLEPDDFETVEFNLYVKEKEPIKLQLEYKDNYNQDYSKIIEVDLPLYTSKEASLYKLTDKNYTRTIIIIIIILIAALVIIEWYKTKTLKGSILATLRLIFSAIIKSIKFFKLRNLRKSFNNLKKFVKQQ